jgi:hypothetical protein
MSDHRYRRDWDELRRGIRGRNAHDGKPLFPEEEEGRHITMKDALEIAFIVLTGLSPQYAQGLDEPLLESPGIQVTTRGLTYSAAQARAWSAYRIIARNGGGFTVNGRRYTSVTPQQTPVFMQRDDSERAPEGRPIFVFNILFERDYPAS